MKDIKNAPNRHIGISSEDCSCGLVHDDQINRRQTIKRQIVKELGGRCSSKDCRWLNLDGSLGCSDIRILEVDHVFDDGFYERRKLGTGEGYFAYILKNLNSRRYQVLCSNCHSIKTAKTSLAKSMWQPEATEASRISGSDALGKVSL